MSGVPLSTLLAVTGASLLAVLLVMAVSFAVGATTGKYSVIDAIWGPGFVAIAVVAFLVGRGHGDPTLRWVALIAVAVWGLRLGGYILLRNHGLPEDARYVDMLRGHGRSVIVRKVQLPQGLAMWFVSIPVQIAMLVPHPAFVVVWIGVGVYLVGIVFESVGDAQLARFKADPANRGALMSSGLWRLTRHPNYFGDSAVWWGLYLMVAWSGVGALTVLSPLLMTYLLVAKTGKALTEKRLSTSKPGYADYVARTSGFFPPAAQERLADLVKTIAKGSLATDFELPDQTGTTRRLSDLLSAGPVVLFFYPAALSSGCTAESCHFRDLAGEFAAVGAVRVGISTDPPARQAEFDREHSLGYPLLSDVDGAVATSLGVKRRFLTPVKRVTLVIGTDRTVLEVISSEMSMQKHADTALHFLRDRPAA